MIGGEILFCFIYHIFDLQKVIEGGPWTFEQSLLIENWRVEKILMG